MIRIMRSDHANPPATDAAIIAARIQQAQYGIPDMDFRAWATHRAEAIAAGIEFRFTLAQWAMWWRAQITGTAARRRRYQGQYQMARIDPAGPYAADNVCCRHIATPPPKPAPVPRPARSYTAAHLRITGAGHPRSRAVVTPSGTYASVTIAARAYGISVSCAHYRAATWLYGWHFATPVKPPG